MKIRKEYCNWDGSRVWEEVVSYVKSHGTFSSVTGIPYSATFVGSCIFIKGGKPGTKRSVEGEYLTGKGFIAAYDIIRTFDEINTGKVKPYIRRQQTPFMGLLFSAGIIEQDNDIFDLTLI